jgi:transcription antitermination factor NusB
VAYLIDAGGAGVGQVDLLIDGFPVRDEEFMPGRRRPSRFDDPGVNEGRIVSFVEAVDKDDREEMERILRQGPLLGESWAATAGARRSLPAGGAGKARLFAAQLVRGTWLNLERIDALVASAVEHWLPERLSVVDRNILRLACYEVLFSGETPPKAAMNEWIDVAKLYGGENSGAFINGIIDRLYRDRLGEDGAAGGRTE